ncbi:MAG: riboflavin biosynthesis protein RibF [Puniceicoccales bacterium]|jgi:riboflavin kinase/FMN adenylyltransferase|nr:riboflavin biosynthesis protein RibF [Puniceicoccales bacterium]
MERIITTGDDFVSINQPVVLAMGAFDGIHIGHQAVIVAAKNKAQQLNALSAVYSFWPHPSIILNCPKQLILPRVQKVERLKNLGIDYFIEQEFTEMFAETTASDFIFLLRKKFHYLAGVCVGENFKFGKNCEGDSLFLRNLSQNFIVEIQKFVFFENQRVSSSNIRKCLHDGHIDRANRMLGYPYYILGTLCIGRRIARTLGYPTLNVHFENDLLLKFGVYLVRYRFGRYSEYFWGVGNFGVRPTFFEGVPKVHLEVHSLDPVIFHSQHEPIEVQFWSYIREEKRFASQELLVKQIYHDTIIARHRISHLFKGDMI